MEAIKLRRRTSLPFGWHRCPRAVLHPVLHVQFQKTRVTLRAFRFTWPSFKNVIFTEQKTKQQKVTSARTATAPVSPQPLVTANNETVRTACSECSWELSGQEGTAGSKRPGIFNVVDRRRGFPEVQPSGPHRCRGDTCWCQVRWCSVRTPDSPHLSGEFIWSVFSRVPCSAPLSLSSGGLLAGGQAGGGDDLHVWSWGNLGARLLL